MERVKGSSEPQLLMFWCIHTGELHYGKVHKQQSQETQKMLVQENVQFLYLEDLK